MCGIRLSSIKKVLPTLVILFYLSLFFSPSRADNTALYEKLYIFGQVIDQINEKYIDEGKVKKSDLIEAALKGMLSSLDPHSSYLDTDTFREIFIDTKGEFSGVGINVTKAQQGLKVISPIDDTPGAKAGILPGDIIVKVDGVDISKQNLLDSVNLIRGKVGEGVELTIRRGNEEPFSVTIVREKVKIIPVKVTRHGSIRVIRITTFNANTAPFLGKILTDSDSGNYSGIILDLRNNPGGLLDSAIEVVDMFLNPDKLIVSSRGREPSYNQEYSSVSYSVVRENTPMVVLINGGSASASEIVAGALQDHKRATIIGERSFGKGSVQTLIPLGDNSQVAIKLTIARYYTPNNHPVQGNGIRPDISIPFARAVDAPGFSEKDLPDSLEKETPDVSDDRDSELDMDPVAKDNQLLYALYFINKMIDQPKEQ